MLIRKTLCSGAFNQDDVECGLSAIDLAWEYAAADLRVSVPDLRWHRMTWRIDSQNTRH